MRNSERKKFQETIKYLDKDEWSSLKEAIDNPRDKLIVRLLHDSGCRVGELCLMKIEHIDFDKRFIRIPAENTKINEGRTVRINQDLLNDIKGYLSLEKRKESFLFLSRQKGNLTTRRIQQMLDKYAIRAGIQQFYAKDTNGRMLRKVTPHTLRHTHIVDALMAKIPITAVQQQVGHKRLTTTQIYSKLAPEQIREAYDRADFE
ncbi:MAG: tyrosine-type recombinase/integrase [Candidatus Altiarchaeota archaeon]